MAQRKSKKNILAINPCYISSEPKKEKEKEKEKYRCPSKT